jgi:hypothetical protein
LLWKERFTKTKPIFPSTVNGVAGGKEAISVKHGSAKGSSVVPHDSNDPGESQRRSVLPMEVLPDTHTWRKEWRRSIEAVRASAKAFCRKADAWFPVPSLRGNPEYSGKIASVSLTGSYVISPLERNGVRILDLSRSPCSRIEFLPDPHPDPVETMRMRRAWSRTFMGNTPMTFARPIRSL